MPPTKSAPAGPPAEGQLHVAARETRNGLLSKPNLIVIVLGRWRDLQSVPSQEGFRVLGERPEHRGA